MTYEALARKWRPKSFGEIVGQAHVTRALANAISLGKVHHAYLFSGTRGVGKTTFARILARALNCEKGPTAAPCLSCAACAEILSGAAVDVQEIDGASHTGIDDVRRLRENAAYAPARLRYKIYIIDEVHMLSKAAFNGLLKIIEEPPPHVVFIFATTEPNRLPDTILSRVQRFDFRMLTEEEIAARLREMAAAEGIECEEDALGLMARYAFGSMRDGQSILEQAAVLGNGRIAALLVEETLGLVGTEAAVDLVRAVAAEGAEGAIRRFHALLARGADLKFLFLSLVDVLRDAVVWKLTGSDELLFRHAPSSLARIRDLCALKSREEWMFLLDIAFRSERDVLGTEFPRMGFELLLLRLVNAPALLSVAEMADGPAGGSGAAEPVPGPRPAPREAAGSAFPRPRTTVARPPAAPAAWSAPRGGTGDSPSARQGAGGGFSSKGRRPEEGLPSAARRAREEDYLDAVRRILEAKRKPLILGLLNQMWGRMEGNELLVFCPHQMQLDRLREDDKWPVLLQAVEEVAGRRVSVRLAVAAETKSPEPEPDRPFAEEARPERKALSDPLLSEILREFEGATVVEVRPAPAGGPAPAPGAGEPAEPAADESAEETEEEER